MQTLFTQKLLKEEVKSQDEGLVSKRWAKFQEFKSKIEAIKNFKEEIYQDGFLVDIFQNSLGYSLETVNPLNFNLSREKKNERDSKKADGVIYLDKKVVGVIELKGQDTKNLDKIETQAFNYHLSHSNSKYIIISNFNELRFYIDKKVAYEKFNLFTLDYEEFKILHLILSFESIKEEIPLKLKEKTTTFEQEISKKLYKDFSEFRLKLFEDISKNNSSQDKLRLLRLTQKLCDRIIFILFAEDRGLLKQNTIKEIREEFKNQKFTDYSLYEFYKIYFEAINKGNEKLTILKYNGGLFAKDELLNSLKISNQVLNDDVQKLSDYDFDSEVSVNILGHIFEQSLTDLEELTAQINRKDFNKLNSKRKKDGVFYTPEYITYFILENSLDLILNKKREELKIEEIKVPKNKKRLTQKEQERKENLKKYQNWLLNLKILDPACGSGAFLNQALEFLIKEHKRVQEELTLLGDITAYYDIEISILENNLYGVDINEDAVEIAKLSLWIKTASKGRELTKLADKILCENSLLNMPFKENSFDLIIGNPPYVRQETIKEQKAKLKENYKVYNGTADLFVYFYELGFKMLKKEGYLGYICSNKFFRAKYGENLREFILDNLTIEKVGDFNGVKVFEEATVDSAITILKKEKADKEASFTLYSSRLKPLYKVEQKNLTKESFLCLKPKELILKHKIEDIGTPLKFWDIEIYRGILTGFNEAFIINEKTKNELIKEDYNSEELIKPLLRGRDIKKYDYNFANLYLINSHNNPPINIEEYPAIKKHLNRYYTKLEKRTDKGKTPYNLRNCAYLNKFEKEKIIYSEIVQEPQFYLDNSNIYAEATSFIMSGENLKYLIALLNSKAITYSFKSFYMGAGLGNKGLRYKKTFLENLPIPKIEKEEQTPFIELVDKIILSKEKIKKYKKHYESLNAIDKIEIEKEQNNITKAKKKIDILVYKLYKLTKDEIKIVEN